MYSHRQLYIAHYAFFIWDATLVPSCCASVDGNSVIYNGGILVRAGACNTVQYHLVLAIGQFLRTHTTSLPMG